ncbi:hypothetical protein QTP70_018512, partial [Hemibagrus guttatus]
MSYRGRTLVINNLAASSLWHKLACVDPPPNLLANIQAQLVDFFWDGLHWIPQSVLYLPKEEGGQGLVQLSSRAAAFRLQFTQRLLTGPRDLVWRAAASGLLHTVKGLGLDRALFLMDTKMLDISGLPMFYRGLFKIWNVFKKQNKGCRTVHWLLEEPLVYGGRLDISGVTVPALSRTLISSGIVTLRELVNVAGSDLSRTEDLAVRMGLRSQRVVNQLLHLWSSALPSEERVQLMGYQHTETGPVEDEPFPRLNIAPDLDGCAGPLLECRSDGEMDFGSVSGKLLYRACVKVLNKKKLSGRVDTPWRSVLGFSDDVKPEWRALALGCKHPALQHVASFRRQVFMFLESPENTLDISFHMKHQGRTFMIYARKGRELADMMERRKVDILCVQETRWKGSKPRSIGAGFKLFYYGVDSKRNGVGVVLKEEFVRNVLEVKRVSDRVMSLKLEIEGVMLNVVSGYAPQVGCELEEKERFWSELDEVMESIPTGERVVIGADFNGHVGEGNTGDEEVMGKFGVKERNLEGQMVVDFAKRMDMGVVNTYFQKREEHRVTYKSGGRRTQVDYILCRRGNLKEISDCKVVVGESVARQHRMVVCRMTLMVCKTKRSTIEKKTKWWKLKKEECCEEFRQKLRQALGGQVVLPDDWETTAEVIRETGRKVLGVSSGRRKEDKETWWWNEEVRDSIQRKRLAKKKLDTREGEKDLYRLARQRDRDGKDVQQVRVIKDRDGRVLTSEESVQRRWKEYFEELMNEENEREKRVEGVNSVEQKVDKIRKDEVRKALKRMKSGKAVGPDDIPVEVWKCLGEAAVEFLASLFNRVLESERMPEEWRRSVLVPIFKNKGDVQSCSNYRGIKLMSHTMKVWERVVEARLRKVVEICEQQYGFMPRKSTTDAIFALRILMEKYRDGQKELHCVFVDLEKAYDRVPREELWYCMRKSGVAEKYVRVVQDMYERSRTVVRCAVGQTEEFKVEVGLHQGSALSPFLFAIVMDQLSEEVRQESPWTMKFADDIVICSESREQVEENLERWRFALERRVNE